ncbi:hypothetical protein BOTBODRAFT_636983 [Botryobasidium botryosum FD-172 SS1]|uniref:Uncharacterized protein n=1 Tax=Botryobasidium botryosum (strain FD-172 SS1) TaxID=930990 RepID=A0A067M7X3_BOTB1|nr:hypothetical protein BOTBODRAFT_636983 [Botryobasidium botryosum FD-172 SS1]
MSAHNGDGRSTTPRRLPSVPRDDPLSPSVPGAYTISRSSALPLRLPSVPPADPAAPSTLPSLPSNLNPFSFAPSNHAGAAGNRRQSKARSNPKDQRPSHGEFEAFRHLSLPPDEHPINFAHHSERQAPFAPQLELPTEQMGEPAPTFSKRDPGSSFSSNGKYKAKRISSGGFTSPSLSEGRRSTNSDRNGMGLNRLSSAASIRASKKPEGSNRQWVQVAREPWKSQAERYKLANLVAARVGGSFQELQTPAGQAPLSVRGHTPVPTAQPAPPGQPPGSVQDLLSSAGQAPSSALGYTPAPAAQPTLPGQFLILPQDFRTSAGQAPSSAWGYTPAPTAQSALPGQFSIPFQEFKSSAGQAPSSVRGYTPAPVAQAALPGQFPILPQELRTSAGQAPSSVRGHTPTPASQLALPAQPLASATGAQPTAGEGLSCATGSPVAIAQPVAPVPSRPTLPTLPVSFQELQLNGGLAPYAQGIRQTDVPPEHFHPGLRMPVSPHEPQPGNGEVHSESNLIVTPAAQSVPPVQPHPTLQYPLQDFQFNEGYAPTSNQGGSAALFGQSAPPATIHAASRVNAHPQGNSSFQENALMGSPPQDEDEDEDEYIPTPDFSDDDFSDDENDNLADIEEDRGGFGQGGRDQAGDAHYQNYNTGQSQSYNEDRRRESHTQEDHDMGREDEEADFDNGGMRRIMADLAYSIKTLTAVVVQNQKNTEEHLEAFAKLLRRGRTSGQSGAGSDSDSNPETLTQRTGVKIPSGTVTHRDAIKTALQRSVRKELEALLVPKTHKGLAVPPDEITLCEFHNGTHPGCTMDDFQVDLWQTPACKWNKTAMRVFAIHFLAQQGIQDTPATRARVERTVYTWIRGQHLKYQRRATAEPGMEKEMKHRAARNQRKRALWHRRIAVLHRHPALLRHLNILRRLNVNGMSSDESELDVSVGRKRYYCIVPGWRHPSLVQFLRALDVIYLLTRIDDLGNVGRGNQPHERLATNIIRPPPGVAGGEYSTGVVKGLPWNSYNPEWLQQLDEAQLYSLNIPKDEHYDFRHDDSIIRARHSPQRRLSQFLHPAQVKFAVRVLVRPRLTLGSDLAILPVSSMGSLSDGARRGGPFRLKLCWLTSTAELSAESIPAVTEISAHTNAVVSR